MNQAVFNSKYKLPLIILGSFLLAAIWVGVGRIFFGVFGWTAFITLFAFAPIILMYGVALTVVVAVRQGHAIYRAKGAFMKWLYATLAALFVLGLSMPDAGDTPGSGGSALTVLLGNKSDEGLLAFSGTLLFWSIIATIITSIVTFVLAFFEGTKRAGNAPETNALKRSS